MMFWANGLAAAVEVSQKVPVAIPAGSAGWLAWPDGRIRWMIQQVSNEAEPWLFRVYRG